MNSSTRRAKSTLFMLLSAFCFSLGYLFVKLGSIDYPFFWLVFVRYLIGLIVLVGILAIQRLLAKAIKTTHFRFHLLRTLAVTASQYSIFYYLTKSNLLNATVLMNTAPLFIPFIDRLFLGYRIAKSTIAGLVISVVGVLLILKPGGDLFQWVSLFGLLAGFLWAISQVIYGYNVRKEKELTSVLYIFLLGTLVALPALFIFPVSFEKLPKQAFEFHGVALLIALGLATLLNQYFRGKAYGLGKPTTLSVLLFLSIVFAGLFDWLFFNSIPDALTIIGSALVMTGASFVLIFPKV